MQANNGRYYSYYLKFYTEILVWNLFKMWLRLLKYNNITQ